MRVLLGDPNHFDYRLADTRLLGFLWSAPIQEDKSRTLPRVVQGGHSSGVSISYPIYDGHGNKLTTLSKNGSGYTYATCRLYDAWGGIRVGATTGEPNPRHCASLGHLQDDESGFVYMRARYYDASSGRFASTDTDRKEVNYFAYASNDPVNRADASGNASFLEIALGIAALFLVFTLGSAGYQYAEGGKVNWLKALTVGAIMTAATVAVVFFFAEAGISVLAMGSAEVAAEWLAGGIVSVSTHMLLGSIMKSAGFNSLTGEGGMGAFHLLVHVLVELAGEEAWAMMIMTETDMGF